MKNEVNHKRSASLFILTLTALSLVLAACQSDLQENVDEDALQVTVSILPQAYFVERIAGDLAAINVMVGPGEEAHTYEPTPNQMKALTDSSAFFTIGVEYEETWLPRFEDINPEMLIVDSAAGIERIPMMDELSHEENDEESHTEGLDPHVWLSPENGTIIAENILTALQSLAPDKAELFQSNFESLITEINTLDQQIESLFAGEEQRAFMVFHPAWGYFAAQYDLQQISVQIGGQDPSVSEMTELVDIALDSHIQVIFIQPTFNASDAEAIANEIGAEVAVVDPLARDWLSNLETAAEAFAAALKEK